MKNVTAEEWADYLSNLNVYQKTECIFGDHFGEHSVMYSKLSQGELAGLVVGEVHYCENGDQLYFIKEVQ